MLPTIKFLYIQIKYMLQILNLNYLPFNSGEITHIPILQAVILVILDLIMNLGFFFNGLGFDFGETF